VLLAARELLIVQYNLWLLTISSFQQCQIDRSLPTPKLPSRRLSRIVCRPSKLSRPSSKTSQTSHTVKIAVASASPHSQARYAGNSLLWLFRLVALVLFITNLPKTVAVVLVLLGVCGECGTRWFVSPLLPEEQKFPLCTSHLS
jgi:hypothetical protein